MREREVVRVCVRVSVCGWRRRRGRTPVSAVARSHRDRRARVGVCERAHVSVRARMCAQAGADMGAMGRCECVCARACASALAQV